MKLFVIFCLTDRFSVSFFFILDIICLFLPFFDVGFSYMGVWVREEERRVKRVHAVTYRFDCCSRMRAMPNEREREGEKLRLCERRSVAVFACVLVKATVTRE